MSRLHSVVQDRPVPRPERFVCPRCGARTDRIHVCRACRLAVARPPRSREVG